MRPGGPALMWCARLAVRPAVGGRSWHRGDGCPSVRVWFGHPAGSPWRVSTWPVCRWVVAPWLTSAHRTSTGWPRPPAGPADPDRHGSAPAGRRAHPHRVRVADATAVRRDRRQPPAPSAQRESTWPRLTDRAGLAIPAGPLAGQLVVTVGRTVTQRAKLELVGSGRVRLDRPGAAHRIRRAR